MSRITVREAQAWVEGTKFTIGSNGAFRQQESDLLEQIEEELIARVESAYDTTTWVDSTTTPRLVRVAIAKKFVAWMYRRQYSEDLPEADAAYSMLLEANSESIIVSIVDGIIEIPGETGGEVTPGFYPSDASSALEPTSDDMSLGPNKFSINQVF
jgi:hypothetical protein